MNQGLSTREAFGNDSPAISSCEIFIFKVFKVGDENIVQLVESFPSMGSVPRAAENWVIPPFRK